MSEALSALHASIDAGLGGVLLANMVEAWLAGNPDCLESVEVADEPQDHRTTPEQTRLHLCAPVDECPGAPPPREHGAPCMHCERWRWSWGGANQRFAHSTGTWA